MKLSLVHKESLDLKSVLKMLTYNPAKIFKIDLPKIEKNSEATFIIFDPEKYLIIDQDKLKTSPTPFNRRPAQGQIMASFIKGKMAYQNKDFRALKMIDFNMNLTFTIIFFNIWIPYWLNSIWFVDNQNKWRS